MSAAVILAGGKSRRMGRDKLELQLGGSTLLKSAVERFAGEFDDVYVSVADISKYPDVTARRIADILPGAGPLSGLHAALSSIPGDGVFLVAADLPYASAGAAKRIAELCGGKDASVIRLPDGKLEPLFAFYRTTLLGRCFDAIQSGDYRMTEILYNADTRFILPEELGALWNEKLIVNINRPEDFDKAMLEFSYGQC